MKKDSDEPSKPFFRVSHLMHALSSSVFAVGIASLFWLIVRSGTKPQRLAYPCQRQAAANVGALVALLPVIYIPRFFRCKRYRVRILKRLLVAVPLSILLICGGFFLQHQKYQQAWRTVYEASRHGPVGVPLLTGFTGISSAFFLGACDQSGSSAPVIPVPSRPHSFTNRVVTVHNSAATTWANPDSGNPHERMNQTEISRMVEAGLLSLTGDETLAGAWRTLVPYKSGQRVAIKLNFNNTYTNDWNDDPWMNPYAELVNAVLEGLITSGVPADRITLADPSRIINDSFRSRITVSGVRYVVRPGVEIGGRASVSAASFVADGSPFASLSQAAPGDWIVIRPATVFADADHIINIPQLKGHGGASVTLGLKNHFGSVLFPSSGIGESSWHDYFYTWGSDYGGLSYNLLADINANPVFRYKTRLVIGDGLLGHPEINYVDPVSWSSFAGGPPELLFFGVDPVAVDSVMFDFLQAECAAASLAPRNDDILHYAASVGLGVHEHWDNAGSKFYTAIDHHYIVQD